MKVLVTGGAGYIGSHTVLEMLNEGHEVTVMDNMQNASPESLKRVQELSGKELGFSEVDLLDVPGMEALFAWTEYDAVVHFAGLKAVGESVGKPLLYYENNVTGTINLLNVMTKYNCKNIVFSSSATVYGDPAKVPVTESFPTNGTNPYGRTKLFMEQILKDVYTSDRSWNVVLLRYFNPVGAHKSGQIGEDPKGIPNNLMPFIQQVAVGKREALSVFGSDYPTKDGTGVRDYIHVVDLAKGHTAALRKLSTSPGCVTYNLCSGVGYSVLEVITAYERASGKKLQYKVTDRRPGDVAAVYGDGSLALKELGWKAELGLAKMCEDSWRWISNNPAGYKVK